MAERVRALTSHNPFPGLPDIAGLSSQGGDLIPVHSRHTSGGMQMNAVLLSCSGLNSQPLAYPVNRDDLLLTGDEARHIKIDENIRLRAVIERDENVEAHDTQQSFSPSTVSRMAARAMGEMFGTCC